MSLRSLRTLLVFLGIAFVGLTAWSLRFFARYQPLASLSPNAVPPELGGIGLQAKDVLVIGHQAGRRRWRIAAGAITFSSDRRSLAVDDIRQGLFYDADARPLVSLTAHRAAYQTMFGSLGYGYANTGTLRLDGGVYAVILSAERPVLQSQSLIWDSLRSQMTSPGALTATLPHLTVTAGNAAYALPVGGVAGAARGTLTLGGGIHAALPRLSVTAGDATYAPPAGTAASPAGGGMAQSAHGTLTLTGGVQAQVHSARGPTSLSCPGLTWNGAQNVARSLGLVTAQIPGGLGEATAGEAEVDTKTGNLTMRGIQGTMRLSPEVQ